MRCQSLGKIKLYTALAHVISQMIGRWLPIPLLDADFQHYEGVFDTEKILSERGFSGINERAWLQLLESDLSSFFPYLPWLPRLLKLRGISLTAVSQAAVRHFSELVKDGGSYIGVHDEDYPFLLRQITRPPLGISILGKTDRLSELAIAVVGSRRASYESLKASVELGVGCANFGCTVVSGGAIGCDIAVHEGMLATEQNPIGAVVVQASGLSELFPRVNHSIFKQIVDLDGALVSERLWFQRAHPYDFPARNRIVSGLCQATVVMSAAKRSGSLITANEALEQGRDVYVFCSDREDIRFDGSNQLIMDGAAPFLTANELLDTLALNYGGLSRLKADAGANYCQNDSIVGTLFEEKQFQNQDVRVDHAKIDLI
jgi:DNA protecting protein DprA